ncbi:MAG: tRNA(fMet)-specific endonuclease VapC [Thermoanaerobaculia bacterium]|nr:tRNA(fMet)-specific endonuclease VapC [Thermoanaerobaculia bacterium]
MTLQYLLDTNIVSEPLKPKPRASVLRRLTRHEDEIAISSLVWHELRYGMERLPPSRRRSAIERYLEEVVLLTMPVLDYDGAAAEWHARERARLAARGETPPFVDGQIASIAHVHDLILVTLNAADFKRFEGLRVESWR